MLLSGKARVAGVMGWPVGHSRSPRLHGHWFQRYGIDGVYVPLPVRPEDVELAFRALPRLGMRGWNVTAPHKEVAARLVDELDPAARRIGAVNTVLVLEDGRTHGLNTDGAGFLANLRQQAPSWRPDAGPVVVLGAGGSARAVAADDTTAEEGVLRSTVRALLAPRRAVPIALVIVPLTIIQDAYSRDALAVPLALLMCGSFLLVGPSLWRALFPMGTRLRATFVVSTLRVFVYAAVGAAVDMVRPLLPAEMLTEWDTELAPYVAPLEALRVSISTDAAANRSRLVLTVSHP